MLTALKACYHMEQRYRTDANFAHVMHMTESMMLIQEAIANDRGKPPMTFEQRLADQQNVTHGWKSDVRRLEKEVEVLEDKIERLDGETVAVFVADDDTGYSLSGVHDLITQARLRGVSITPDQLEDALEGRPVFL